MIEPRTIVTLALLGAACSAACSAAWADDTAASADLRRLLEQQEQRIKVLERKLEIEEETAQAAATTTPVVKASPKGFAIQSADGANVIKLRGLLQVDGERLVDDADLGGVDGWQDTRVRPILEGTVGGLYDFRFMPEFGRGKAIIQEAWVKARLRPALELTAGKLKAAVGLERLQSAGDLRFVQRAFPTSLVPNRDVGLQLGGMLVPDRLEYEIAYLNGSNDGSSSESFSTPDVDVNDAKDWALRVFATPFATAGVYALRGLGFGLAATYTDQTGDASNTLLPSFRTPGQQTFYKYRSDSVADGRRLRLAPQLYYYRGSVGLLGEYVRVEQDVSRGLRRDSVDHTAWQLALSWFATGEEEKFRGYTPASSAFDGQPGIGAVELCARYQVLEIAGAAFSAGADSFADPQLSSRRAAAWSLGVNWYLNQNVKSMFDYERTAFDGGAAAGANRPDEGVLFARIQFGI